MKHTTFIIAWLLLGFANPSSGQLVSVKSSLAEDSILIGEQTDFTLKVTAHENSLVRMPTYEDTLTREIEIRDNILMDTLFQDSTNIYIHTYRVSTFDTGTLTIPSQQVVFRHGAITDTILTRPVYLHVASPAVDTTQPIKPIKPPINTPLTIREVLPWVLIGWIGLLIITLMIALVWIARNRGQQTDAALLKPSDPPHEIALRNLDELEERRLPQQGMVKEYYTRLTEVIRRYISDLYGINAMEKTSYEIVAAFSRQNTDQPALNEQLDRLLQLADLVKFAREDPLPEENERNMEYARNFVLQSYPIFYSELPRAENHYEAPEDNEQLKKQSDE